MTKFELIQKSSSRTQATFHVMADGKLVGQISTTPKQGNDLLLYWKDASLSAAKPAAGDKASRGKTAVINALTRGPKLSRAAVLRS